MLKSIAGNHALTTIAYYGVATNLVLYLTQILHEGNSSAAANYSNWLGTSYLTSLIGAFLGDAYWGRYRTAIIFSAINLSVSSTSSLTPLKKRFARLKPSNWFHYSQEWPGRDSIEQLQEGYSIWELKLHASVYEIDHNKLGVLADEPPPVMSKVLNL